MELLYENGEVGKTVGKILYHYSAGYQKAPKIQRNSMEKIFVVSGAVLPWMITRIHYNYRTNTCVNGDFCNQYKRVRNDTPTNSTQMGCGLQYCLSIDEKVNRKDIFYMRLHTQVGEKPMFEYR